MKPKLAGRCRRLFLGLGANIGSRRRQLATGLKKLGERGVIVRRVAPLYETEPVGLRAQPAFLNTVAEVETSMSSLEVIRAALAVEAELGRSRTVAGGPRRLDIDLLLDGNQVLEADGVQVPHPRLHQRRFVLIPLTDLAPELRHPVLGKSMASLLRDCPDGSAVAPFPGPGLLDDACEFAGGQAKMSEYP